VFAPHTFPSAHVGAQAGEAHLPAVHTPLAQSVGSPHA